MLAQRDFERMLELVRAEAPAETIKAAARKIQNRMNPHPAGQLDLNVPRLGGEPLPGVQHKYRETVLFFPTQGQTCHAYCSYCFRWPQFVGLEDLKFASKEADRLAHYVESHSEVTDVLLTGGDPLLMSTRRLRQVLARLRGIPHVKIIRIGSKMPAFDPFRILDWRRPGWQSLCQTGDNGTGDSHASRTYPEGVHPTRGGAF